MGRTGPLDAIAPGDGQQADSGSHGVSNSLTLADEKTGSRDDHPAPQSLVAGPPGNREPGGPFHRRGLPALSLLAPPIRVGKQAGCPPAPIIVSEESSCWILLGELDGAFK